MTHLTLQEVIDRINKAYRAAEQVSPHDPTEEKAHQPEYYIPLITRRLASFIFSTQRGG